MTALGRLQARAKTLANPRLEGLFLAAVVLYAFWLGARSIADDSMLIHIRTGIDMVSGDGIPRVDPYSWTAAGDPWVAQSWLPEWTYGMTDKLGGLHLVVLEQAVLLGLLAWLMVGLARAGSPLRSAAAAVIVVGIGSPFWTPRPLIVGLICMALLITVVERRRSPWLLVFVVWLWVQSHGSFLLGGVWLGARALGEWRDWRSSPRESLRYLGWYAGGLAVSVLNPLGFRLLTFPVTLGGKREVFQQIIEWRGPDFQGSAGRIALIFLALALVVLFRARLSWRDVVPSVAFLALALVASWNIPLVAVVLAAPLGRSLRRSEHPSFREKGARRSVPGLGFRRAALAGLAAAFVVVAGASLTGSALRLGGYPQAAATQLSREGLLRPPLRLANQEFAGGYLIYRFGRDARVFIDDRFDMYPVPISEAYFEMLEGGDAGRRAVEGYQVDVVLWERSEALPALLEDSGRWRRTYEDKNWLVLQRVENAQE